MPLQESGEMYLESIYMLSKKSDSIRAIDVGEYMGYSKPSVSRALSLLKSAGYVEAEANGYLKLTPLGKDVAEKMYERHTFLTEVLMKLGVDKETASDDACKIEHHISEASFTAIKNYYNNNLSETK